MISRRIVLGAVLAGLVMPGVVQAEGLERSMRPVPRGGKPRVQLAGLPDAADLVAAAKLGGMTGFALLDASTGQVIEAQGADQSLPPASVAKTITALYALARLGPGYRFTTRLVATGPVLGGVVQGDLILIGAGDPTLDTDRLGDMAQALAATGIRGVTGRFLAEVGTLPQISRIDPEQPVQVGYNPAISGLNLNFNRVNFEWRRGGKGYKLSMDARGERFVPPVRLARIEIERRDAPLYTFRQTGTEEVWTVAASALGDGGSRWLPVRQPGLYAGEVFQTLARAQGIELPDVTVSRNGAAPGTVVVAQDSEELTVILRDMLRFSTNLTAEVVGLTASGAASLAASGAAMTAWAADRLGMIATFADHSGLGPVSRVTPLDMARALAAALKTPTGASLPAILRDVKMRDASGAAVENSPVRVVAKSGTLNFVSGLAGVISPPSGRELVFAVFSADTARRDALGVEDREDPAGGSAWVKRARRLQGQLIHRWGTLQR